MQHSLSYLRRTVDGERQRASGVNHLAPMLAMRIAAGLQGMARYQFLEQRDRDDLSAILASSCQST